MMRKKMDFTQALVSALLLLIILAVNLAIRDASAQEVKAFQYNPSESVAVCLSRQEG